MSGISLNTLSLKQVLEIHLFSIMSYVLTSLMFKQTQMLGLTATDKAVFPECKNRSQESNELFAPIGLIRGSANSHQH